MLLHTENSHVVFKDFSMTGRYICRLTIAALKRAKRSKS